jgi:monoamine oxidase
MIDTLILGGGLAGTAAALWLADLGRTCTIVEARPRLGGRAHARPWGDAGVAVDYGGGWIRKDHAQMIGLAQRLGLALSPRAPITQHSHFRDGMWHAAPAEDMHAHQAGLAQLLTDAAQMADDTPASRALNAMTLQDYLTHRALPASVEREVLAWWALSGSAPPDQVGVNEYLTPKLAKGLLVKLEELAFTVQGGASIIPQEAAKASGADVVLGDAAERLEDRGDCVQATLASGRKITARTALVALPVNTLSQIRVTPPLNPAQSRLRKLGHQGAAIKLMIRAQGPSPGHLATGEALGLRWIYADRHLPDGSTLLVAFGLNRDVGEPTLATVQAAMAAAFPTAEVLDFDWHDWVNDPFARGTWVSPALHSLPYYAAPHWAMQGRIAFAGSDLYSAEQGWFEGALLTARAAVAALDLCLKQNG